MRYLTLTLIRLETRIINSIVSNIRKFTIDFSWHTKFNAISMTHLSADLYWCTQSCWQLVKKKLVLQSRIPSPSALSQEPISKPVTDSILFQKYMALHWPCLITSLLTISLLCVQERTSLVKLLTQVSAPGLISGSLSSSLASSARGFYEKMGGFFAFSTFTLTGQ